MGTAPLGFRSAHPHLVGARRERQRTLPRQGWDGSNDDEILLLALSRARPPTSGFGAKNEKYPKTFKTWHARTKNRQRLRDV
eukprot:8938188-Pyramimonas_sp.AAC.1